MIWIFKVINMEGSEAIVNIWEKSDDESAKAYHAFCVYRDMSPFERSYQKVADVVYGKESGNVRQIERWGSKFAWVARVDAWDSHQRQQITELRDEMKQDLTRTQFDDLKKLRSKCIDILVNFNIDEYKEIDTIDDPDRPGTPMRVVEHSVRVYDLKTLADALIKTHTAMRLALGMSTSITSQSIDLNDDSKPNNTIIFEWVDDITDNSGFESAE